MGAKSKVLKRRRWKHDKINTNFGTELSRINENHGVSSCGDSGSEETPNDTKLPVNGLERGAHLQEDAPDMAAKRPHTTDKNNSLNNNSAAQNREYRNGDRSDENEELLQAASGIVRKLDRKKIEKVKDTDASNNVCPASLPLTDEIDYTKKQDPPSSDLKFKWFDILINLFSIGSFLVDVGTDIFVAVLYLKDGLYWYFGFTVAFICVPAIINTIFGLIWYVDDHRYYRRVAEEDGQSGKTDKPSVVRWILRFLFLIFQIGPILRYIDVIVYGCKSWSHKDAKKRHYQELMVNEDADAALLRLLECFIEAAPQLTLQLYILCVHGTEENLILKIGQVLACFASLASLSWALMSYNRSLRMALTEKANVRALGMFLQFVWRFFMVGSRILCMALFASVYGYWIFVICGCHWFVMLIWMLWLKTNFCSTKCKEFFFNVVIATVHIFCFVNVIEGHTRLRYLLYYVILFGENVGLTFGWYIFAHTENIWYLETAISIIIGGFFLGLFFQILYYVFFHPNNYPPFHTHKRIRMWIPLREILFGQSPQDVKSGKSPLSRQLSTEGQRRMKSTSKYHDSNNHQPYL